MTHDLPDAWERLRASFRRGGTLRSVRNIANNIAHHSTNDGRAYDFRIVGALGWDLALHHLALRVVMDLDALNALLSCGVFEPAPGGFRIRREVGPVKHHETCLCEGCAPDQEKT